MSFTEMLIQAGKEKRIKNEAKKKMITLPTTYSPNVEDRLRIKIPLSTTIIKIGIPNSRFINPRQKLTGFFHIQTKSLLLNIYQFS